MKNVPWFRAGAVSAGIVVARYLKTDDGLFNSQRSPCAYKVKLCKFPLISIPTRKFGCIVGAGFGVKGGLYYGAAPELDFKKRLRFFLSSIEARAENNSI
jgi:hypothetical protein